MTDVTNSKKVLFSSLILVLILSLLCITPTALANGMKEPERKIVGYYTSWSAYSGYTLDKVDATKLTHINYSFANINEELKIVLGDPYIDLVNLQKIMELKMINPNLKVLVSVGGWSWSDKFSDVALTDESRIIFANSCIDFMREYGFDGIDIDWEFPVRGGLPDNIYRQEDKENFTLLLKELRETFDTQGQIDNKSYILTFAGGASSMFTDNIELEEIHKYVDFANIMSYDMHGSWDKYTDFNSPLYTNNESLNNIKLSVDESMKIWINRGFPKEKIVMGISFYGKQYNNVSPWNDGLYQLYDGNSTIGYGDIVYKYLDKQGTNRYFHYGSLMPWIYDGTSFITYEDEESISYKADYIKLNELGGAMIWEVSGDFNGLLLNQLYNGLK